MAMTIKDLLNIEEYQGFQLLAGRENIMNVIRWPYLLITNEVEEWIYGGELVFVYNPEFDLVSIIHECKHKKAAGIVIVLGEGYIPSINNEAIALAESYAIPLISMPWYIKLIDIFQEITVRIVNSSKSNTHYETSLTKLLTNTLDEETATIAYDAVQGGQITVFEFSNLKMDRQEILIVTHIINGTFIRGDISYTIISLGDDIVLWTNGLSEESLSNFLVDVIKKVELSMGNKVYIGTGKVYHKFYQLKQSYKEAKKVVNLIKRSDSEERYMFYNRLGMKQILLNVADPSSLLEFYDGILHNLIQYDTDNSSEYLHTLKIYIESNCNMQEAAENLFIHKNTMKYRLKKIEDILGMKLNKISNIVDITNAFMSKDIFFVLGRQK